MQEEVINIKINNYRTLYILFETEYNNQYNNLL